MSDLDDELPPLEDMSTHLKTLKEQNEKFNKAIGATTKASDISEAEASKPNSMTPTSISTSSSSSSSTTTTSTKPKTKKPGLKGGFFNSQPKKKATTTSRPKQSTTPTTTKKSPDIIEVKPTQSTTDSNPLRFNEVQEAMKMNNNLMNNQDQWLTNDLLMQMAKNPKLLQGFSNPKYMKAIEEMKTNPGQAMKKYGDDPELREFLFEFSKIMGGHFEQLGKTKQEEEEQKNSKPQESFDDILEQKCKDHPALKEVIQDSRIKQILHYLKTNERIDFNAFIQQHPDLGPKLRVLIDSDLIQIGGGPQ
mmetsp:Transcript_5786/g.6433  ORF Transcript_5786/g.6433 Transcript_5786/m.6433 type:complete len:306 (-) Transcript_5786:157-1074(-)